MTPLEIRVERVVTIPADVLWQIIEPPENLGAWLPLCERCERLGGEGLGRRQRMYVRWGRKRGEIDQEVTGMFLERGWGGNTSRRG